MQLPNEMAQILYSKSYQILSTANVDKHTCGLIAKNTAIDKVNTILFFSKHFADQNAVPYFNKVLKCIEDL